MLLREYRSVLIIVQICCNPQKKINGNSKKIDFVDFTFFLNIFCIIFVGTDSTHFKFFHIQTCLHNKVIIFNIYGNILF